LFCRLTQAEFGRHGLPRIQPLKQAIDPPAFDGVPADGVDLPQCRGEVSFARLRLAYGSIMNKRR
jgi:hypothetical protein